MSKIKKDVVEIKKEQKEVGTITWEQLQGLYKGLQVLKKMYESGKCSIPFKLGYAMSKNIRWLKEELEDFEAGIQKIMNYNLQVKALYYQFAEKKENKLVNAKNIKETWEIADNFNESDPRLKFTKDGEEALKKAMEALKEKNKDVVDSAVGVYEEYMSARKEMIPLEVQKKVFTASSIDFPAKLEAVEVDGKMMSIDLEALMPMIED